MDGEGLSETSSSVRSLYEYIVITPLSFSTAFSGDQKFGTHHSRV